MVELVERIDRQTGEIERVPLPFLYARAACEVFWYGTDHRIEHAASDPGWLRIWLPSTPVAVKKSERVYAPRIEARTNSLHIATSRSLLQIFFSLDVSCIMRGEPFMESDLKDLYRIWRDLPRADEVREAIIAKAAWLEDNPGFRGIPVKQSPTTARRMSNDDWRNNSDDAS